MRPMVILITNIVRGVISTLLILLLVGCGGSPPVKPRVSPSSPNNNTGQAIAFEIAHMHIYSHAGIQCYAYDYFQGSFFPVGDASTLPHGNLVLASDRTKYDSGEVQQMRTYVTAYSSGEALPTLPSAFSWVPGGLGCDLDLQLTNTGDATIQLRSMDLRLLNDPIPNNRLYRLIEICSFLPNDAGCPGLAGGGAGNFYFQLSTGNVKAGKVFTPQNPFGANVPFGVNEGEQTIPKNNNLFIHVNIVSGGPFEEQPTPSPSTPNNLIYSILPELVLDTPSGQQIVALPALSSTLYFSSSTQFSCYALQGSTIVPNTKEPRLSLCI